MSTSTLKVLSFNLRVDVAADGINSFTNRFDRVLKVIDREKPDLIGFQEVTDAMRARLHDHIPGYTVQGCGRGADYHGESMLIAYRTGEVELIDLENRWLSATPTVPGTTYGGDQSGCPRMFTAALLKHDRVERPFRFVNTHLDHEGPVARQLEAAQLVDYLTSRPEPFILTGDFNATPDTPEIAHFTEAPAMVARGVCDCTAGLGGTYHGFGVLLPDNAIKIDYIFTDAVCVQGYAVSDTPVNGQYYSDHNAVAALIEL